MEVFHLTDFLVAFDTVLQLTFESIKVLKYGSPEYSMEEWKIESMEVWNTSMEVWRWIY